MKVQVLVRPKATVLDPQGQAVMQAIQHLGMEGVTEVRVGKLVEITFADSMDRTKLELICRDLLSNPVMEDFEILPQDADVARKAMSAIP